MNPFSAVNEFLIDHTSVIFIIIFILGGIPFFISTVNKAQAVAEVQKQKEQASAPKCKSEPVTLSTKEQIILTICGNTITAAVKGDVK